MIHPKRDRLIASGHWKQIPTTQEDNHYQIVERFESNNEVATFYIDGTYEISHKNE